MTAPTSHSITFWISRLKDGDEQAAAEIWGRFFGRVCALARKRIGADARRLSDEEDVAISAFNALCMGARDNRFRSLEDRDDLWQILAMITSRKSSKVVRAVGRRRESGESAVIGMGAAEQALIDIDPTPEVIELLASTGDELMGKLEQKLQKTAMLKLSGYKNSEIAVRLGRTETTVERYLKMIRRKWDAA